MFAHRMWSMDELAMGLAFSRPSERLYFAMDTSRNNATSDSQEANQRLFREGPRE